MSCLASQPTFFAARRCLRLVPGVGGVSLLEWGRTGKRKNTRSPSNESDPSVDCSGSICSALLTDLYSRASAPMALVMILRLLMMMTMSMTQATYRLTKNASRHAVIRHTRAWSSLGAIVWMLLCQHGLLAPIGLLRSFSAYARSSLLGSRASHGSLAPPGRS